MVFYKRSNELKGVLLRSCSGFTLRTPVDSKIFFEYNVLVSDTNTRRKGHIYGKFSERYYPAKEKCTNL